MSPLGEVCPEGPVYPLSGLALPVEVRVEQGREAALGDRPALTREVFLHRNEAVNPEPGHGVAGCHNHPNLPILATGAEAPNGLPNLGAP